MKNFRLLGTFLLLLLAVFWSFWALMPSDKNDSIFNDYGFSTDRALKHVEQISLQPHGVGFPAHTTVRDYIISELEKLGLETTIQSGYSAGDWGNYSKAVNILAHIKGSENGKTILLLSHYDSSPHSSLGASDAGSGVATILEGIRAYLSKNKTPKNDVVIVITDAEELGLNGADLFVNQHPWIEDVALVLNFEARGSGGPSYMFMETNRGNEQLIKGFVAANPQFPVANSLAYSIYKMLPNDTDLTVFREDRDIEGFNFAFIDDHYDYHTEKDSYSRLDRNTLTHQGSYLMPLLGHFSNTDLTQLKSLNDYVYFNVPFFNMVTYPFDWIWPMWFVALALIGALLFWGFKQKNLDFIEVLKGFLPLLLTLLINGIVGYFCWSVLKWVYPHYSDMLHGFTYNGHTYILSFVFFSIGICFWVYNQFKKLRPVNLLVAPIVLWLLICWGIAGYLPGASFFIIPLFALLVSFLVVLNQKDPNPLLLLFLALPAIFIYVPLIQMFPIALGLKMLITSTLLTSMLFYLLLPLFDLFSKKKLMATVALSLCLVTLVVAHFQSGFNADNAKPTSLVYLLDADSGQAQWATYEHVLSDWTSANMGPDRKAPETLNAKTLSSKYSSGFTYVSDAPLKEIGLPSIEKIRDTVIGENRLLEVLYTPHRNVNRLEVFTNKISLNKVTVNGIPISEYYLKEKKSLRLFTHYISDNDPTSLELLLPKDEDLELAFYEASNDLLIHPLFKIPPRTPDLIPMPFVLNDAILIKKTMQF
jgi:hypothetical protein